MHRGGEKKFLNQNWQTCLVGVQKRDDALRHIRELHQGQEKKEAELGSQLQQIRVSRYQGCQTCPLHCRRWSTQQPDFSSLAPWHPFSSLSCTAPMTTVPASFSQPASPAPLFGYFGVRTRADAPPVMHLLPA